MRRRLSLSSVGLLLALLDPGAAAAVCPDETTATLEIRGGEICEVLSDAALLGKQPILRAWIERSAAIVSNYYAGFPARRLQLRIAPTQGSGVDGGNTVDDEGLIIRVRVGRDVTPDQLRDDWVLVHEMIHLALPELGRSHDWLAEGLATYVEGIARAQAGNRPVIDVWSEYTRRMPMGLPHSGDGGMDDRPSWGRIYWGGALFCLQADIAIREQTTNRTGLREALRAILRETGGYASERRIDEVMRIGDAATGTHVLEELYSRNKSKPVAVDLDALWKRLGVPDDPASQPFNDWAPLAEIRKALTAP